MIEDRSSNHSFQITRNEKENGSNKLMSHFQNSSFLAQQEELSMFIKNMPIIRIQEIHSLNKLIELLIRQNEALGTKCQQNVLTVKQMFNKHEQLIKANHHLQKQLEQRNHLSEQNLEAQQQIESYYKIIENYEHKFENLSRQLQNKEESIRKLSEQSQQLIKQKQLLLERSQQVADLFKLIGQKNYKRGCQKIKELNSRISEKGNMGWADLEGLDRFMRQQKKRAKYLPKVREMVEVFCNRSLKMFEFADAQTVKQQLKKEISNLLDIIDDLVIGKKINNLSASQSRLSQSNYKYDFFEGMVQKMIKDHQNSGQMKDQLANELASVRQELHQYKKYYEQYLIDSKLQFQGIIRKKDEQLVQKTQILQFYQEERQKSSKQQMQFRSKLLLMEQTLKAEKSTLNTKEQQVNSLRSKHQILKNQSILKQKQIRQQWQENMKTYQYKLSQKQELLQEEQTLRRNQKKQLEDLIAQLKGRLTQQQERETILGSSNRELIQAKRQLQESLQKMHKQIEQQSLHHFKQLSQKIKSIEEISRKRQKELTQLKKLTDSSEEQEKQKNLMGQYIKELQTKNKDLLAKLKTAESKKGEQKTAKKQINAIKQTIIEEKKYCRELQQSSQLQKEENLRQKQQNHRLKSIIKQMKRQLQDVYHQFNQLKSIQNDRQKLLIQMEKSDRSKQELYRSYESLKLEIAKIQQQNKGLALQVKHYRNALSRIEALRF